MYIHVPITSQDSVFDTDINDPPVLSNTCCCSVTNREVRNGVSTINTNTSHLKGEQYYLHRKIPCKHFPSAPNNIQCIYKPYLDP